jgi:carboxypeptidase C (cathepsin A)
MSGTMTHATTRAGVASSAPVLLPPLLPDDEAVVVSEHRIETAKGSLVYDAPVGHIPIRNVTGELHGRIFYVAYTVKSKGAPRPITFAWNGGPFVASAIVHMEGFGPGPSHQDRYGRQCRDPAR